MLQPYFKVTYPNGQQEHTISLKGYVAAVLHLLEIPFIYQPSDSELVDDCFRLGGDYSDYHINIGDLYYSVSRKLSNGNFFILDGSGDLSEELQRVKLY